jgi:hypothetical protein
MVGSVSKGTCQYCSRPTAGDICPAHGYVGAPKKDREGVVPTGIIVLWSGATTSVPKGWALCDGTNGTPNLRDKFVVGAGSTYAVAATGGSNAAHTHSIPSLTADVSGSGTSGAGSSHDHTVTVSDHAMTVTDSHIGHGTITTSGPSDSAGNLTVTGASSRASTTHTHTFSDYDHAHGIAATSHTASSGAEALHTHGISLSSSGTTGTGTSGTGSSMPAYYALAYIMKL